jgi:hypothetical protein
MKNYLVMVEVRDGEHEHNAYFMIKAPNDTTAEIEAEKQKGFVLWGDDLAEGEVRRVDLITKQEAKTLDRLGVCNFA